MTFALSVARMNEYPLAAMEEMMMANDPAILKRLNELLAVVQKQADPRRAGNEWKEAYRLLLKTDMPAARVADAVGMRDVAKLAGLVDELQNPAAANAADKPSEEDCRKALAAFRKRWELTVLDEESKLGRNPLTKGGSCNIAGIAPLAEWPAPVWQELVLRGQILYIGHGMYTLPRG